MDDAAPRSAGIAAGNSRLERAAWPVAVVVAAVFLTCLQFTATAPFKLATFAKMAHFHAAEPFQHRVLVPAIVAGLHRLLPASDMLLFGVLECVSWIALIGLAYRALLVFRVGRGALVRRVLAFSLIVPMLVHLVVPELYMPPTTAAKGFNPNTWAPFPIYYYVYDLPAAAFTLAFVLMLVRQLGQPSRRGLVAYLALFALATANRETTLFVIPFSALLFWRRLPPRRWLGLMLAQVAVFAAVELPLLWLFRNHVNPVASLGGSRYENHIFDNLSLLANPLYVLVLLARFMAGLYLPVLLWRRFLDRSLVCALAGFALPLIVFALMAGRLQEHRIFIEAVPLVWVAAMQAIARRGGQAPIDQGRRPPAAGDA